MLAGSDFYFLQAINQWHKMRLILLVPMAKSPAGRYWVRISVPAQTISVFLKAKWVGVIPLHPLLSH